MITWRRGLVGATALILLQSCSHKADRDKALASVARFHRLYNEGALQQLYSESDQAFKKGITQADWIEFASAVRRKLGKYETSAPRGSQAHLRPEGTLVVLSVVSTFERAKALEDFVFLVSHERAELVEYNINSRTLVIN